MEEYIINELGIEWDTNADATEAAPFINTDGSFDPDVAEEYYS
jgi:hypothetical protein